MRFHFVVSGPIEQLSGGYIYNREIITELAGMGCDVMLHELPKNSSGPGTGGPRRFKRMLSSIPDGETAVIDSLVAARSGTLIRENATRLRIVYLLHLPFSLDPRDKEEVSHELLMSEKTALLCSYRVVVTSCFARQELQAPRYGVPREKIFVVEPGMHTSVRKRGYSQKPRKLLSVANMIGRKGYVTLLDALASITDLDWLMTCCGTVDQNDASVRIFNKKLHAYGLRTRVLIKGPVSGDALVSAYLQSDLFIAPSYYETLGMALTEAACHGLPVVTSVDPAVNPFLSPDSTVYFRPKDSSTLGSILRDLLSDAERYHELCEAARRHEPRPASWRSSAEKFLRVLAEPRQHLTPLVP